MSGEERETFQLAVGLMIGRNFPQFDTIDLGATEGWDLMSGWIQFERGDPRRWGVVLSRYYAEGPESFTILSVGGSPQ